MFSLKKISRGVLAQLLKEPDIRRAEIGHIDEEKNFMLVLIKSGDDTNVSVCALKKINDILVAHVFCCNEKVFDKLKSEVKETLIPLLAYGNLKFAILGWVRKADEEATLVKM